MARPRFKIGDRVMITAAGKYFKRRGVVEHVRKVDGYVVLRLDGEPPEAIFVVHPLDASLGGARFKTMSAKLAHDVERGPFDLHGRDRGQSHPMGRRPTFCAAIREAVGSIRRLDYNAVAIHDATGSAVARCELQSKSPRGGHKFSVRCHVPAHLRRACKPVGVQLKGR